MSGKVEKMSKQKTFSLGQTLVGSTSFAIGVAGQKQERLDLPETEENDNLVTQTRQLGGETGNKNTESGNCSHVLAPALVNTGKLAKDVVDEASRSVVGAKRPTHCDLLLVVNPQPHLRLKATKRAVYRRARSSISVKPAHRSRLPTSGFNKP